MTLIECFSNSHIDNIAACLRLHPEKLVMVGQVAEMAEPVRRYQKLLNQRNITTEIVMCDVQPMDLNQIYTALKKCIPEASDCVIDLTGGDTCVIMAVGAVLAEMPPEARQRIRVEKFDHAANAVRDCFHNDRKIQTRTVCLTVEEWIELHGGALHRDIYQPPKDIRCRDLEGVWKIVCSDPKEWNLAISRLCEFESQSDSRTQISLSLDHLRSSISNFESKESTVRDLLGKLQQKNVIDDRSNYNTLEYTYRSPLLRHCTTKAGNVLETKTLLEARAVMENGKPYFQDCRMSVSIDWDGVIHKPAERVSDTCNEIDVVLMHETTPLFVSCKNGNVEDEELYKLHTVAERFGGPYAKKMLIATDLDRTNPKVKRPLTQRAWDMGIFLITDAADLSSEEWHQAFKRAMQKGDIYAASTEK